MPLKDVVIRNAKPREKPYKLADEKGLFLLILPSNAKYWRFKYRFGGKEKLLALGVYPDVSLADARDKRDEARKLLANGSDPGVFKQVSKHRVKLVVENIFEMVAREWYAKYSVAWTSEHGKRILCRFEKDIFPCGLVIVLSPK